MGDHQPLPFNLALINKLYAECEVLSTIFYYLILYNIYILREQSYTQYGIIYMYNIVCVFLIVDTVARLIYVSVDFDLAAKNIYLHIKWKDVTESTAVGIIKSIYIIIYLYSARILKYIACNRVVNNTYVLAIYISIFKKKLFVLFLF